MKETLRTVTAYCPLCKCLIPIVFLKVESSGWWRKNVQIKVEGDATDYVMHMWSHQQGMNDYNSLP